MHHQAFLLNFLFSQSTVCQFVAYKSLCLISHKTDMKNAYHLQIICKTTFRLQWYYYDQPQNESFCNKSESVQYNAALAITGAIRGTSKIEL